MNALAPVRTVAPLAELLSLAGAKAHLRVEGEDEDALIAGLVAAATDHFDGYSGILGQALLAQTWAQSFDAFPSSGCLGGHKLRLPLGPLSGAAPTIAYFNSAGVAQVFAAFWVATDAIGPMLLPDAGSTWPTTQERPDAVTVTWTCGFGVMADAVPPTIVHAVKLLIAHWYENRGPVNIGNITSDLSWSLDQLIGPHRKIGV